MPYPISIMTSLYDAKDLIDKEAFAEAAQIIDNVWDWADNSWESLNDFESIEFLGFLARVLKSIDQTHRQIIVLEHLCSIAEQNLENRGIMAVDDDIRWTGMDFIELGLAYLTKERPNDALKAFEKAKYILEELGWLVEVEKLLSGEPTSIGPSPFVKKRKYEPKISNEKIIQKDDNLSTQYRTKLGQDVEERHIKSNTACKIAKIILLESVFDKYPVEPWNPLMKKDEVDENLDLLTSALQTHLDDCNQLDVDIPIIIGVPPVFLDQIKEQLKKIGNGGLRSDQIYLIHEPYVQGLNFQGLTVMKDIYNLEYFMAGGGHCLLKVIENGLLARLWKEGIRWLFFGQLRNPHSNIHCSILQHLLDCNCEGIVEVIDRKSLPKSIVHALQFDNKSYCIDERRLSEDQRSSLGMDGYVCTGNFWISIENLIKVYEINLEDLESKWVDDEWISRISEKLCEHSTILTRNQKMIFATVVPIWEIIRPLNLVFTLVESNRVSKIC
jgi:tetratricopeptide (TPR) repeat protein